MKVIVVGFGIQGKKRKEFAKQDCIACVDPYQAQADYKDIRDVPLNLYDAALVCTPDENKMEILEYLLKHKKHVLVEKPLMTTSLEELHYLRELAQTNHLTCYTAYNHRFEPHFVQMKKLLDSQELGKIFYCRMFYGNGTARDVRNSLWRDQEMGVLKDLGSHLLDTVIFWFNKMSFDFQMTGCYHFENKSPDHVIIGSKTSFVINLEMSLLSWRNHFVCDIIGEKGSAHIDSLCKWGPSRFIVRKRKLPSGRPDEKVVTLIQPDPTWQAEYTYFKSMCKKGMSNIANDFLIHEILQNLTPIERFV